MDYQIEFQKYAFHFALPSCIAENLPEVDGNYLKVALQIFQNPEHAYSSSLLSTLLEMDENKVMEALLYWESKGALKCIGKPVRGKTASVSKSLSKQQPKTPFVTAAGKKARPVKAPQMPDDDEIAFLMQAAEDIMGRPITSQERTSLFNLCTVMNMPADVIIMIMQYCSESGGCSLFKVESICVEWAKEGIYSHEAAESKLKELSERDSVETNVARCLQITKRKLTKNEAKYAHTWVEEWGFKYEMIAQAYEITVNNTGGLSLAYLNKVLENWSKTGIRTPAEISNWNWQNTPHGKESASYSTDELQEYWDIHG